MALLHVVTDTFWERVVPLIVARASHAVLHPLDWGVVELIVLGLVTQIGLEFYRHGIPIAFQSWEKLPARGKPLDVLAAIDRTYITFSQVAIVVMTFHYLQFMAISPNVLWKLEEVPAPCPVPACGPFAGSHCARPSGLNDGASLPIVQLSVVNTCIALPAFFVVYDFFYAPFHRALHHSSIYKFVHKHHHRQVVPTRGNTDAINVHPFEFISGEYNHILAIYLVSRFLVPVHAITCVMFLVVGGCLATLNHTRLDMVFLRVPFTNIPIFAVRAHDTHHAIPNTNYGQYIMFWDWVMGTFRPHPQDPGSIESLRAGSSKGSGAWAGEQPYQGATLAKEKVR